MRRTATVGALAGVLVCGLQPVGTQAPTYRVLRVTIADLGTLGGPEAVALDINDVGEVVGWSHSGTGLRRGFLYRDARMSDVGPGAAGYEMEARGVSDAGEIVGWGRDPATGVTRAFYYVPGSPPGPFFLGGELFTLPSGCRWDSFPTAISNTGFIVGFAWGAGSPRGSGSCVTLTRAVQWRMPAPALLEAIPGTGPYDERAWDVNGAGVSVGKNWERANHGARWRDGVTTIVPPPADTATVRLAGGDNTAFGINDRGHVAGGHSGARFTKGGWEPFTGATVWSGTSPHSILLGTLPTGRTAYAREINEEQFAVGHGDTARLVGTKVFAASDAFVWHKHFGMVALPRLATSGAHGACESYAVNRLFMGSSNVQGTVQAVGSCTSGSGSSLRRRAVRWDVVIGLS
jgi:probable HAF family extracellular repeat protein